MLDSEQRSTDNKNNEDEKNVVANTSTIVSDKEGECASTVVAVAAVNGKKKEASSPTSTTAAGEETTKGENGDATTTKPEVAAAAATTTKDGETTTPEIAAAVEDTTTMENKEINGGIGVKDDDDDADKTASSSGDDEGAAKKDDNKNDGEGESAAPTRSTAEAMDVDANATVAAKKEEESDAKKEDEKDVEMNDAEEECDATTINNKDDKNNTKIEDKESSSAMDTGECEKPKERQQPTSAAAGESEPEPEKQSPGKDEEKSDKTTDNINSRTEPSAAIAEDETTTANTSAAVPEAAAAPSPPPPVLKGTLSYNVDLRRHVIRGMWNYENSSTFPPQRFELLRTLDKEEDPKIMPKDGEFHGSFSLAYFHTTSKGKQKERSKVITEFGVNITFTKVEGGGEDGREEFKVDGKGTNQFGIFHINGTAHPSPHDGDHPTEYSIVLRKRYEPADPAAADGPGTKKRKSMDDDGNGGGGADTDEGPLPAPSKSYPKGVVCLQGKLDKEDAEDLGATDQVHRINGMWSSGLNLILADPHNTEGLCNRFEYEHKSAVPSGVFPVSGRYSGWFHLTSADQSRTTIQERDVMLRFTKNNAGHHNVEGKGSNAFGKYTITGTLSIDNVITIFRHFKPIKVKASRAPAVTSAPPPINKGGQTASRRPLQHSFPEPRLTMDEVVVPGGEDGNGDPLPPIQPPPNTSYSAVSQGVLRLNEDGSHQCTGKWAVTREHFTSGQTSPFNFRLEPHFALEAVNEKKKKDGRQAEDATPGTTPIIPHDFPLDSALYKGSFQLKKKGTRYDTIVDQQIVMKFRKSTSGAFNVYGRGINGIGVFNLVGTLIITGKSGGQVELYRMYPPEHLAARPALAPVPGKVPSFANKAATTSAGVGSLSEATMPTTQLVSSTSGMIPGLSRPGLLRRESTRLVKLPSRLEDDDPQAQLARVMEKCVVILRHTREKDIERGAFFSEAVDPIALGIPTYRTVIAEPMDLGTVARKLEANLIATPEEFARLVRLTFENAMTFNVDPNHSVHLSARYLLVEFNKKFRDIDRLLESLRRAHKGGVAEVDNTGKQIKKDGKKRKRPDEPKSIKRRRLDEAQTMSAANASAMAAIVAAAPQGVPNAAVSRGEFNMMIHMIQLLQKQIVQTHNAVAELSPGDDAEAPSAPVAISESTPGFDLYASLTPATAPAPAPVRKKPKKKAPEPLAQMMEEEEEEEPAPVFYDDTRPLTLQEQETLTETINNMPSDHIPGVIQIIRESASLEGDEDEIDLEIDQLDTVTQRKLLRHVSKYIKQPKKAKGPKKPKAPTKAAQKKAAAAAAAAAAALVAKKKPDSPKKADPGSYFAAFGNKDDDSDSDSDDDDPPKQAAAATPGGGKQFASAASSKSDGFDLGDGFSGLHNDDDDDLGNGGITANWNISKAVAKNDEKEKGGEDDDWGAAREEAAAVEARNKDRKAREEKLKADAEVAKVQRLADAKAQSAKLTAKKLEDEENEARKKAEKEKEEKDKIAAARAAARAQVESVEQTVDLDAQRDIMRQYEQSFLDKELGSASPSSDFGF